MGNAGPLLGSFYTNHYGTDGEGEQRSATGGGGATNPMCPAWLYVPIE